MRCPACGARYQNRCTRCPECGALQDETPIESSSSIAEPKNPVEEDTVPTPTPVSKRRPVAKSKRSLLEFPSVNRSAMPEWRKELGVRVREVQERRAREAALETAEIGSLFSEVDTKTVPMLELLPQAEMPPMNPVVVAALKRIERAQSQNGRNHSAATAVAYEQEPAEVTDLATEPVIEEVIPKPERVYTLAVVPNPELISAEVPEEIMPSEPRKPIRVIDGHNDPALNYLDSVPRSMIVETCHFRCASIFRRMFGALVDLAVIGVLALPILALTELTNFQWQNLRVIGITVGTLLVIGFFYLTISVAFTGRTIGMKLFSLRVVDARNGLIPTGRQSAGRSLLYLLSLAGAGITLLYTFINADNQTVHDRFTRTMVIRA